MNISLVMLYIVCFLDLLAIGLIVPQLATHARRMGFSHVQIGLMGGLYSASQTISAPIIGGLSDIKGTKPIFLICLCVCSIAYYCLGIASSIASVFVIRGFLGFFKQIQLLIKAVVTEYSTDTKEQGVLYGKLIAIAGFGMSVGPVISGHVTDAYPASGFTILAFVVGTIFLINIGLITLMPIPPKEQDNAFITITPSFVQWMKNTLNEFVQEFYEVDWSMYWDVFLYGMLRALAMGLYLRHASWFLKTEHGVSSKYQGYIAAFQGVVGGITNFFIRFINEFYKNDTDFTQRTLHVFIVLTLSLIGLASVSNVYVYVAILIPKAICLSVGKIVSLEMTMSRCKPAQKGAVMGVADSVKSLMGVVIPIIGGLIAQYVGVKYAFYAAACVTAVGVAVSYSMRPKIFKNNKNKSYKKNVNCIFCKLLLTNLLNIYPLQNTQNFKLIRR